MEQNEIRDTEEGRVLTKSEAIEFGEFCRARRETEISLTLAKLVVDASCRETDKSALRIACDAAKRIGASAVLVSPINAASARRHLEGSSSRVCCLVGGTGETVIPVKKTEAKRAMRAGAGEIRLVPCYSALVGGNLSYLKREIKRVRRAVKRCAFSVSLDDHALTDDQIALGIRAACEGKAGSVVVRGETDLLLRAVKIAAGRTGMEAAGVENAEQLRLLVKAGAARATTAWGDKIAAELHRAVTEEK